MVERLQQIWKALHPRAAVTDMDEGRGRDSTVPAKDANISSGSDVRRNPEPSSMSQRCTGGSIPWVGSVHVEILFLYNILRKKLAGKHSEEGLSYLLAHWLLD